MSVTLSPSDSAILGAVFHGHTEEIDNTGFLPSWLESNITKEIVSAAFTLCRQKKSVNLLNIMATSKNVPTNVWPEIKSIASTQGDVDYKSAVKAVQDRFMQREAQRLHEEMTRNLNDPKMRVDIKSWLPAINHQLTTLFDTGKSKESRPSSLLEEDVPTIKFRSLIPGFNELWGGGYRDWMLGIYAGCPGHGKSTALITHAVDSIVQGKQVSLIVNELMPQVYARRVLRGCCGVTDEEIQNKRGSTTERHEMMMQWKSWLDSHLRIYDADMFKPSMMRRIISWDRPDVLIIDYLRDFPGMLDGRGNKNGDAVGEMAYELLNLYRDERVCIITAGQMSDNNSKAFQRNNNAEPAIIYGSARCIQAAGLYIGMKRDAGYVDTEYFRKWKDSFTGRMDVEVRIPFNQRDGIYQIPNEARTRTN